MKLFSWGKDGGIDSNVWGFWLIEMKKLFSIVLLKFANGSRDAFHNHAFTSLSFVLKGKLTEHCLDGDVRSHWPSLKPVITTQDTFHKVVSEGTTWVLSLRGPWADTWTEYLPDEQRYVTLTNGRQVVS